MKQCFIMKQCSVVKFIELLFVSVAFLFCYIPQVQAQATRTWVSGVGDDANPCSRTAPCKTFAGAISKTATAGIINTLDPGGFGAVTITKSITIESNGVIGGVLVSGTNGFTVNTPNATDLVVIRGLTFEGLGTGINGISFVGKGALFVENCSINNFTTNGINFVPTSADSKIFVKDTVIRNIKGASSLGVLVAPTGSGTAKGSVVNTRLENNRSGLQVRDNGTVSVTNSVASGNINSGFSVSSTSAAAVLNIDNSTSSNNGAYGVIAIGALGTITISNVTITANNWGIKSNTGGNVLSFLNNLNFGNGTEGDPTLMGSLQ